MAIAYDNSNVAKLNAAGTSNSVTMIVGSGANRAGMVLLEFLTGGVSGISVTGAGVTWTLVAGTDSGSGSSPRTLIYAAANPSSGSQTISVSWTTASEMGVFFVTVTGASQSTPAQNGTSGVTAAATTDSVVVTSSTTDLSIAILANNDAVNVIASATQTLLATGINGTNNGNFVASRATTPAASVTHSATGGGGATPAWAHSGADFLAAAAAAGVPQMMLLGAGGPVG